MGSEAVRPSWLTAAARPLLPADADDDPGGPGRKLNATRAAMPGVVPVQVIPAIRTAFEPEGSAAKRESDTDPPHAIQTAMDIWLEGRDLGGKNRLPWMAESPRMGTVINGRKSQDGHRHRRKKVPGWAPSSTEESPRMGIVIDGRKSQDGHRHRRKQVPGWASSSTEESPRMGTVIDGSKSQDGHRQRPSWSDVDSKLNAKIALKK